jgi:hypothetical protein
MRTYVLVSALLLTGAAGARAEGPAFTIKIKTYPDKGQVLLCRETDQQTGTVRFIDSEGNILQEQKPVEETEENYRLTVLEAGDRCPRRYQQSFDKATHGDGRLNRVRGYQGETILYEMTEGKYQLTLGEKADVSRGERDSLASRANSDLDAPMDGVFQTGKPVKVGEAWEIDGKLLAQGFGGQGKLDMERTKGHARLMKAYKRGNRQFGVIEVNMVIAYSSMDKLKFDPPAVFRIQGTLDTAIDGSSAEGTLKLTSRLNGRTQLEQKGARVTLEISRTGNVLKERTAGR